MYYNLRDDLGIDISYYILHNPCINEQLFYDERWRGVIVLAFKHPEDWIVDYILNNTDELIRIFQGEFYVHTSQNPHKRMVDYILAHISDYSDHMYFLFRNTNSRLLRYLFATFDASKYTDGIHLNYNPIAVRYLLNNPSFIKLCAFSKNPDSDAVDYLIRKWSMQIIILNSNGRIVDKFLKAAKKTRTKLNLYAYIGYNSNDRVIDQLLKEDPTYYTDLCLYNTNPKMFNHALHQAKKHNLIHPRLPSSSNGHAISISESLHIAIMSNPCIFVPDYRRINRCQPFKEELMRKIYHPSRIDFDEPDN